MKIISVAAMRALEAKAVGRGIPEYRLMYRAGTGAAAVIEKFALSRFRRVVFFCGGGNNAGDAIVCAGTLTALPHVLLPFRDLSQLKGAAAEAYSKFASRLNICSVDDFDFAPGDLIVDALLGIGFGSINSMPVFNFVIAGVFSVLALCMVGVFNFNFGSSLRISPQKLKGAAWFVAFIMGAMAALLAGACVAPVVISVLIFVAREYNSGNHWALLLPFLLGIGMALPWPFAGMGMSVLPKPGKFMIAVK